ncbi:arylsulfotransferase family protein [Acuticoccus sp. M5D2P5]|uniref:arylsulfotransferase family protein n=1 Tax=Acuticoccus kalidii TaxID=2910977 RepID=UPI001F3FA685|nr:arylsulfotransferase family protein [Acuticoccus kalidii]MCF3933162.1 arylsulfotransferase family protein [Acuticoccus kalidii]
MSEKLPIIGFVVSIAVLATGYGVVAGRNDWFPNPQVSLATDTVRDLGKYWKNDIGLEPTRHLVPARVPGEADRFVVPRPDEVTPGYTLIAGLSRDQDQSPFVVTMYDTSGAEVHRWPIDYAKADPEGLNPLNTMLHGMEVLEDGSLVLSFDAGDRLVRFDACGNVVWATPGPFHHIIGRDVPNGLIGWRDLEIVHVDIETGEATKIVDIENDMMNAGIGQQGILGVRTHIQGDTAPLKYENDAFHANDVEPLRPEMADAFPQFAVGDLLISLRELNLVAVVDRESGEFKWWQSGPWLKQHDPDFEPDGTITVFDNNTGTNQSRILRIDPKTRVTEVLFAGNDEIPFYTAERGKHQLLPSGNILITEPQHGRVFEVNGRGELVWERDSGWDENRNLIVTEARHLPLDFFDTTIPQCATTAATKEPGRAAEIETAALAPRSAAQMVRLRRDGASFSESP